MSHYEEQRKEQLPALVEPVPMGSDLQRLHDEITQLNTEIAGAVSEVKENQILKEFALTVKNSGAMGLMGMVTKMPEIIPELAPLFPALQKLILVGEKQHQLTGEIIQALGGNHV